MCTHARTPQHTEREREHRESWISLCAQVLEDKQYVASVSLWQTELDEVKADTSLSEENGEPWACIAERGRVHHFLLFCNFIKEI